MNTAYSAGSGEYILDFVNNLQVPFITTLHTVLPNPSAKQKEILKQLGEKSVRIVTMAKIQSPFFKGSMIWILQR